MEGVPAGLGDDVDHGPLEVPVLRRGPDGDDLALLVDVGIVPDPRRPVPVERGVDPVDQVIIGPSGGAQGGMPFLGAGLVLRDAGGPVHDIDIGEPGLGDVLHEQLVIGRGRPGLGHVDHGRLPDDQDRFVDGGGAQDRDR